MIIQVALHTKAVYAYMVYSNNIETHVLVRSKKQNPELNVSNLKVIVNVEYKDV